MLGGTEADRFNLVGRIAVSGNAVGSGDNEVYGLLFIRNPAMLSVSRVVLMPFLKFISGEAASLKERAGF